VGSVSISSRITSTGWLAVEVEVQEPLAVAVRAVERPGAVPLVAELGDGHVLVHSPGAPFQMGRHSWMETDFPRALVTSMRTSSFRLAQALCRGSSA
jgi:hypothetical protein